MGTDEGTYQSTLTAADVAAANDLTRRWFAARPEVPAAGSGLGIWPLLAVLATGAVADTRDELLAAAGLDAERAAAVPALLLETARTAPALRIALGVWAGSRVTLDPDWTAGLPGSVIGSLTGDLVADKAALDAWASDNTDGLIDKMPIELKDEILLVLASALLVRTTWTTPFDELRSPFPAGPWSNLDHRVLTATYSQDVLRVGEDASVLTVRGDRDIDVLLALGRDDLEPREVFSRLLDAATDPAWGRSSTELAVGERAVGVEVTEYLHAYPQTAPEVAAQTVPFTVDADLDLIKDAAALGLVLASDGDRARFDRLAAQPLVVSQARQSCTAVFSATGFEAAAVTAFGMAMAGALPPQDRHRHVRATVTFDRPFAYLARHRPTGLVLAGGWVTEPDRAE
ncbi:serpin family protein [Glycomyces sp. NRRL B-16210]|uniref:serpin family protein n=1 Tax=Glycomyces sp. NRRL B-16210 TaxID=1463821 RepID=UPI00068E29F7|nr:serpin family protein [Glycomyces sp. NRRL B-16210]